MAKKYITNKQLLEEILKSKQKGEVSNTLALAFIQIATRYASKAKFSGYTYKDDMIGDSILQIMEYWDRFDETKSSNPFAYYTQVIHNAFIQRLNKEKTQRRIRDAQLEYYGYDPSYNYQDESRTDDSQIEPTGIFKEQTEERNIEDDGL